MPIILIVRSCNNKIEYSVLFSLFIIGPIRVNYVAFMISLVTQILIFEIIAKTIVHCKVDNNKPPNAVLKLQWGITYSHLLKLLI